METYRLDAACKASGMDKDRAARMLDHGTIQPDHKPGGRGRYREFSRPAIINIAIINHLVGLGISPAIAARAAYKIAHQLNQRHVPLAREFLIGTGASDSRQVSLAPDQTLDELIAAYPAAWIIDLTRIVEQIDQRLKETEIG